MGMSNKKFDRFYLPTKSPDRNLSCVMHKSYDYLPILSVKIEHVLSLMILLADVNKFCLCCHGDCLQQTMNIYFSYLLCLIFLFVH